MQKVHWPTVFGYILVIVCLLVLIVSYRVYKINHRQVASRVYFATEYDLNNFNTGDIVGVQYYNPFGYLTAAIQNSRWTHTGLIWRHPETQEIFVLEAARYRRRCNENDVSDFNGIIQIPLRKWLKFNQNHQIVHTRLKIVRGCEPIIRTFLCNQIMYHFNLLVQSARLDTVNWRWYRLLQKQKPYSDYCHNPSDVVVRCLTCNELTVHLLQQCGVFKKVRSCSCYYAGEIIEGQVETNAELFCFDCPVLLKK